MIGAWPAWPDGSPKATDDEFRERIASYAVKALRESKRRSSWTSPDEAYEDAARRWTQALLAPGGLHATLAQALPPVVCAGERVSLSRLVLKLTMPGVPDTYRGCEYDDFSLVDPDNRRPVDFEARAASLGAAPQGFGPLKQAVTAILLRDRARAPRLYASGDYQARPSPHPAWITFSRRHEGEELIVAALVRPFDTSDMDEVLQSFSRTSPQESGWSNLLRGHALDQRKHGGAALPAMVLRKSR